MKRLNKFFAVVLIFAIIAASFSMVSVNAESQKGDIDADGEIGKSKDLLQLRNYLSNNSVSIKFDLDAADVYIDGVVDSKDVLVLRQYIAGIITEFPTGSGSVNPNLPIGVDGKYLDKLADEITINGCANYTVAVNQVGYGTNQIKIATLTEGSENAPIPLESLISNKKVYLVDVNTNQSVATFTSEKRGIFSKGKIYSSKIDFSSFKTAGTYRLYTPIGYSYPIIIKDNPYQGVTDSLIKALYYQRCGCALDEKLVGSAYARTACHVRSLGSNAGAEVTICDTYDSSTGKFVANKNNDGTIKKYSAADFAGGLHDAGDYGRYVSPAAQVVGDLLYAYEMNKDSYTLDEIQDNANENIPDVLDEARYEAKWLMTMQAPSGGIYYKICTDTFASATYSKPENDRSFNEVGLKVQHVNMESTTFAAGALASCYYTFKDIDPDFANNCLDAAKKAYKYYVENVESSSAEMTKRKANAAGLDSPSVGGGAYAGSAYREGSWYMACALYRATGDSTYSNYINECISKGYSNYTSMTAYNTGGFGTLCYLLMNKNDKNITADSSIVKSCLNSFVTVANSAVSNTNADRFNSVVNSSKYVWGSNAAMNNILKSCAISTYFSSTNYSDTIRKNMNFFLGVNPRGYCLVTGAGPKASKSIHHFPSVIIQKEKGVPCIPGLIVGGYSEENSAKGFYYDDANGDYVTNEICVYWNSSPIMTFGSVISDDNLNK